MSGAFPVEFFLEVGPGPHTFAELAARMKVHVEAAHGGGERLCELQWQNVAKTMRFQVLSDERILLVVPIQVDDTATVRMDFEPQRGRRRSPPGPLGRTDEAEQELIDAIAAHLELTSGAVTDLASILNEATADSQLVRDLIEFAKARDIDVDKLLAYLTSGGRSMTVRVGGREVHYEPLGVRRRVADDQSVPVRLIPRQKARNTIIFVGIAQARATSHLQLPERPDRNRRYEFSTASPGLQHWSALHSNWASNSRPFCGLLES